MRAGQRSYVPGAGHVLVEAVEPVALADLTDEDGATTEIEDMGIWDDEDMP